MAMDDMSVSEHLFVVACVACLLCLLCLLSCVAVLLCVCAELEPFCMAAPQSELACNRQTRSEHAHLRQLCFFVVANSSNHREQNTRDEINKND